MKLSRVLELNTIIALVIGVIFSIGLNSRILYVSFFIIVVLALFLIISNKAALIPKNNTIDFIVLSLLFTWLYGVIAGLLNGNDIVSVISNFAGLLLYSLYYIFHLLRIDYIKIIKAILFASLVSLFFGFMSGLYNIFFSDTLNSMGNTRIIIFGNMMTYIIIYAWSLVNLISPSFAVDSFSQQLNLSRINAILLLIISALTILFSWSKGFMLSMTVITLLIFLLIYKRYLFSVRVNKKMLYFFIVAIFMLLLMILTDYIALFTSIFDKSDVSNQLRLYQLMYLVDDLTLFGHGAGALIHNYGNSSYGVELVYVNIVHKYGLFSIFIFLGIALTMFKLFIKFKHSFLLMSILLSFMMYIFPSLGNPILLAPLSVILHVIVLYTITCLEQKKT